MAVSAKYDEFNHWWATEGDWVEEPNYRRNGMSGVQCVERNGKKLYVKRMTHHLFHSVRYPFGRPTIVREVAVIKELERAGVIVPKIVFGEAVKIEGEWRALLVTEDMAVKRRTKSAKAFQIKYENSNFRASIETVVLCMSVSFTFICLKNIHIISDIKIFS